MGAIILVLFMVAACLVGQATAAAVTMSTVVYRATELLSKAPSL
jgi:Mn2+/Fe2+ NRAMP family transporter